MNKNSLLQVVIMGVLSLGGLGTVAHAGKWVAASNAVAGSGLDLQDYEFAVAGDACSTAGEQRYNENLSILICNGSKWITNETNGHCLFEYGQAQAGTLDLATSPHTFLHSKGSTTAYISHGPTLYHNVGSFPTQILVLDESVYKTLYNLGPANIGYTVRGPHTSYNSCDDGSGHWFTSLTTPLTPPDPNRCGTYTTLFSQQGNYLGVTAVCREPDGCNWCN